MKTTQLVLYAIIIILLYKIFIKNSNEGFKNDLPNCSRFMTNKMACDEASKQGCKWNLEPHDNPIENCICIDNTKCSGGGIVSGPMEDLKKQIQQKLNEYNALKDELDLLDIKPPEKMKRLKQIADEYEVLRNQAM